MSAYTPHFSPHCLKRAIWSDFFLSQWNNNNTDLTHRNVWTEVYLVVPQYSRKYARAFPKHASWIHAEWWGDCKFGSTFIHKSCFLCADSSFLLKLVFICFVGAFYAGFCFWSVFVCKSVFVCSLYVYSPFFFNLFSFSVWLWLRVSWIQRTWA